MKPRGKGNKKKIQNGMPMSARFGKPEEQIAAVQTATTSRASEEFIAQLEFISSIVIPALFLLFNLTYWPWLLVSSKYFTQQGVLASV